MDDLTMINWRHELDTLIGEKKYTLLNRTGFVENAFDPASGNRKSVSPSFIFDMLMGDAAKTLQMMAPFLRTGIRMLEIGGGVGLSYSLLRSKGFDIVSLEPGAIGYGDRHGAGLDMMELLGIDSRGWIKSGIENFSTDSPFDLIFSYFVLEHVSDLERAFLAMHNLLGPNGIMIHRCPNYAVPYETHFNIPLVPFFPKSTVLLFPKLGNSDLWKGLQFTTVRNIGSLCKRYGFKPTFQRGMTAWAFEQVLTDPLFAARKQRFLPIARVLRATGLLNAIKHLPATLDVAMEFTAEKL
ncbi:MAG: class I SAM-dependent methyltransferase [Desulfatirhabdiaceae bacterium]